MRSTNLQQTHVDEIDQSLSALQHPPFLQTELAFINVQPHDTYSVSNEAFKMIGANSDVSILRLMLSGPDALIRFRFCKNLCTPF